MYQPVVKTGATLHCTVDEALSFISDKRPGVIKEVNLMAMQPRHHMAERGCLLSLKGDSWVDGTCIQEFFTIVMESFPSFVDVFLHDPLFDGKLMQYVDQTFNSKKQAERVFQEMRKWIFEGA